MNPQSMSPRMMYSYHQHTNIPWNIPQYQPKRHYQDAALQQQKRKWASQKKGQKTNKYVTRRGGQIHPISWQTLPYSVAHQQQSPWKTHKATKLAQFIKVNPKLIKQTYLDKIQIEQAKRKVPGVSTYSLQKDLKQIQAEITLQNKKGIKSGEKRYFYQDIQHLSNLSPGSGQYNPHSIESKHPNNKNNIQYWIKKHNQTAQMIQKRQSSIPGSSTYIPLSQTFKTFQHTERSPRESHGKKNGFGSDARFAYVRPIKRKILEERPSPTNYNTSILWRGKKESKKRLSSHELLWKGTSLGVYH